MSMTYALLVGIDAYPSPIRALRGCVADVDAMEALLGSRVPHGQLDVHVLENQQATRSAVIDEFRDHLGQAVDGDVVIFWYSGHGSQQPTTSTPGIEPDGLDETLVLVDSRAGGGADLADKELAALIAEVAKPGVHVFVGLDCCHSGSGTREILPDGAQIRRAPADRRVRSINSYLPAPPNPGRHVLLAACRSDQTAKEVPIAGAIRGALTAAVEEALREAGDTTTYRHLHRTARAAVGQLTVDQVPQLEVTHDEDSLAGVFNGVLAPRSAGYFVTFDGADWLLDAGAVHGIPPIRDGETTLLNVLDPATAQVLTTAKVVGVRPESSVVALGTDVDRRRSYHAAITAWPLPKAAVAVGDNLSGMRDAINASAYLTVAESAEILVRGVGGDIEIIDASRRAEPVARIAAEPARVVASLEQIVRWRQILELHNPGSGLTDIELEVRSSDGPVLAGSDIILDYTAQQPRSFTVSVRNNGTATAYCAVVALSESYAVDTMLPGNSARLEPGQIVTSQPIQATVPDNLWNAGVTRRTDVLKLIVAGAEFDPVVLTQAGLTDPVVLARTRDVLKSAPRNTLARLLCRVQQRELQLAPGPEPVTDWSATSVRVISERPQPGVAVGPEVQLATGVTLEAPAGLTATASLTTTDLVERDLTASLVPPMLLDDPSPWAPLGLLPTRDAAACLDVLELRDVTGEELVTSQQPMILRLAQDVSDDESVLVLGFDGQNYLVVGHMVRRDKRPGTTIRIDTLPLAITTKSLTGSIRLLFRRFLHKATGKPGFETRLAVVTLDEEFEQVRYDDDHAKLADAVAHADRILLLIHGILGDTAGMVIGSAKGFGAVYDLMLTFDYENINTPVSDTAAELKRKLVAAGVARQPGQQLDIVAHSMGGLVARWLIEQDADQPLVSRLITAGTPNGGSPWPVIHDWATTALTFGLNQLAQVFWPAVVVSGLVRLVEKVDVALDDMAPNSSRLQTLFASADPHLPYTVLVGDHSLMAATALEGRVASILAALKRASLNVATSLAFLRQPNDLAVSVDSAKQLPANRSPAPTVVDVACDHLTFFSSDAGRAALSTAVAVNEGIHG
jgi:triacylglycerol esterase/lipase EstA (alpha/beta hydrolase family)